MFHQSKLPTATIRSSGAYAGTASPSAQYQACNSQICGMLSNLGCIDHFSTFTSCLIASDGSEVHLADVIADRCIRIPHCHFDVSTCNCQATTIRALWQHLEIVLQAARTVSLHSQSNLLLVQITLSCGPREQRSQCGEEKSGKSRHPHCKKQADQAHFMSSMPADYGHCSSVATVF